MFATRQSSLKIDCVALALAFASSSGMAGDPVPAGFDRMLAHAPTATGVAAAASGPTDPLVAALVVPLREGTWPTGSVILKDPVAESFSRLFTHEPNWTTPAPPEGTGADPLIASVVWPLLRTNQYTVAGAAPAARH